MNEFDNTDGDEIPPPAVVLISFLDVIEQHVVGHGSIFSQNATNDFIQSCAPPIDMADLKKVPVNQQRLMRQIAVSESGYVISRMALIGPMKDKQPELTATTKKVSHFVGASACLYSKLLQSIMIANALEECKGDEIRATQMVVQGLKVMGYEVETKMVDSEKPNQKICVIDSGCHSRSDAYKQCNQVDAAGAAAARLRKYER